MAGKDVVKKTIKVDITSDAICPFCMLGLQNLRRAIQCSRTAELGLDFQIEFHPFLLDPSLTETPVCKRSRYVEKFGKDRFEVVERNLVERGKKAGIDFNLNGMTSSTTTYHRLIHHAYAVGGQQLQLPLIDRLNQGYFEKAKDIGDKQWLAQESVEVGVFKTQEEALEWLNGQDALQEVKKGFKRASDLGITGVPFFVFGNKYAISGAQPPESFFEVFQEISKGEVLQCSSCTGGPTGDIQMEKTEKESGTLKDDVMCVQGEVAGEVCATDAACGLGNGNGNGREVVV